MLPGFLLSHIVRFRADMVIVIRLISLALPGQVPLMGGLLGGKQFRGSTLGCVGILFHPCRDY